MARYEAQIEIGLDAGALWEKSNAASSAPDGNGVRGWSIWPDAVNVGYSQTPITPGTQMICPVRLPMGLSGVLRTCIEVFTREAGADGAVYQRLDVVLSAPFGLKGKVEVTASEVGQEACIVRVVVDLSVHWLFRRQVDLFFRHKFARKLHELKLMLEEVADGAPQPNADRRAPISSCNKDGIGTSVAESRSPQRPEPGPGFPVPR